jgi:hypothetical protein
VRSQFKWRHQYDVEADEREREVTRVGDMGESLTQQQFTKDADINEIVRRFGVFDINQMPPAAVDPSAYGDVPATVDLRTVLHIAHEAEVAFMSLPAPIRGRFENDPASFHEFVMEPSNREECEKLGLLVPRRKEDREGSPRRRASDRAADEAEKAAQAAAQVPPKAS